MGRRSLRHPLAVVLAALLLVPFLGTGIANAASPLVALTVGAANVNIGGDVSGWNTNVTPAKGWRFNNAAGFQSLVMSNYAAGGNISAAGDLNILSAGLNRVGILNVTGDLSVTGSGILLVDKISCTGLAGLSGVAVFLRDQNDTTRYVLQNDGLLDEKYTLPSGYSYAVPSGTSLLVDSCLSDEDPDRITYVGGGLTVPLGASLVIEDGGLVELNFENRLLEDGQLVDTMTAAVGELDICGSLLVQNGGYLCNRGTLYGRNGARIVCGTSGLIGSASRFLDTAGNHGNLILENIGTSNLFLDNVGIIHKNSITAHLTLRVANSVTMLLGWNTGSVMRVNYDQIRLADASSLSILAGYKENNRTPHEIFIHNGISGDGTLDVESGLITVLDGGVNVSALDLLGCALNVSDSQNASAVSVEALKICNAVLSANSSGAGASAVWGTLDASSENSLIYNSGAALAQDLNGNDTVQLTEVPSGINIRTRVSWLSHIWFPPFSRREVTWLLDTESYSGPLTYDALFDSCTIKSYLMKEPPINYSGSIDHANPDDFAATLRGFEIIGLDAQGRPTSCYLSADSQSGTLPATVIQIYADYRYERSDGQAGSSIFSNTSMKTGAGALGGAASPCSVGAHMLGAYNVTKAAACSVSGTRTATCSVCSKTVAQTIAATGKHTFGALSGASAATCGAAGSGYVTCSACGARENRSIPATGKHSFGSWSAAAGNKESRSCSVCGATETRTALALAPSPSPSPSPSPTPKGETMNMTGHTLTVDGKALGALADSGSILTLVSPFGEIVFDAATVKALSYASGGGELTFTFSPASGLTGLQEEAVGNKTAYILHISDGKKEYAEFSGVVTVRLRHALGSAQHWSGLTLCHIADDGTTTRILFDYVDGCLVFRTGHFSVYAIEYDKSEEWLHSFTDVRGSDWFYPAVREACKRGTFVGTSAATFSPNTPMTRAMFVMVLYRQAGLPAVTASLSFDDVPETSVYASAIAWARSTGVTLGVGQNRFGPNQELTRQEMACLLVRYLRLQGVTDGNPADAVTALTPFSDTAQIHSWAYSEMAWAAENGILQGSGGKLSPAAKATRAETAQVLMNLAKFLS